MDYGHPTMKQITPIVGISKIIAPYNGIICGFDGVLTKGNGISSEALKALKKMSEAGKEIVILSNTALRVYEIVQMLEDVNFDLSSLRAVITAGEIVHYKLKNTFQYGRKYYNLGSSVTESVFAGLGYQKVDDLGQADFVFIGDIQSSKMDLDDYKPDLQEALSMRLPLVCVGADVSRHMLGEVCLSAGAVAEQYAVMGGDITTIGKPDKDILLYAKEAFSQNVSKILFIGDSFSSDVRSAAMLQTDCVLISKGIHMHTLGEGYIPDVQKARQLAINYDAYPDYLISGLRW